MARKITAIRKDRPEIEREKTAQMPQIIRQISRGTSLNEGSIRYVIYELRDFILESHRGGQAVKIEGLGIFTPTIRMNGELDILFRPDPVMLRELNDNSQFAARILNRTNIGKTADDLVAQWNADHPDDLVVE